MPKIVILGGGFAGVAVARRLERLLRPDEAEIVMISRENYTIFTPMLPEVASGGIETRHIVTPVRAELKRTQFVLGDVTAIDPAAKRAYYTHTLLGTHESIDYDQLVLGVGAITSTFGLPGIAEHALPLKRIEDAERLRNHVIATLERADVTADPAERKRLLTYAFVGGGYTGVEAAGEMVDFVRSIHRFYRSIERRDISIVLIEGGKRLLPTLPEEMSDYTARNLSSRGVDLVIGTNVASADADGIVLADGRRIESRTLVWTAGVRPAKLVEGLDLERARNGALVTRPDMSVPGCERHVGDRRLRVDPDGRRRHVSDDRAACDSRGPGAGREHRRRDGRPADEAVPLQSARHDGFARGAPRRGRAGRLVHPQGLSGVGAMAYVLPRAIARNRPSSAGDDGLDARALLPARHRRTAHGVAPGLAGGERRCGAARPAGPGRDPRRRTVSVR